MADKSPDKIDKLIEAVEILTDKVKTLHLYLRTTSSQIEYVKDQQSVINNKLNEVQETQETHTGSLIGIEDTIKWYDTMYGLNEEHIQRLQKRIEKTESQLNINVDERLIVPVLPSKN